MSVVYTYVMYNRVSQKILKIEKREDEIIENVDFKYSSNRASFMGNPVSSEKHVHNTYQCLARL